MARASKALATLRVEDLAQVRLDGAFLHSQIREFVREREKEPGSPWFLQDGEEPLSDSQLRRYTQRADRLIAESFERSRKRLLRRHLAQRRNLYARAVTTGDLRTALASAQDEAKLEGLYPATKAELTGKGGAPIVLNIQEEIVASMPAALAGIVEEVLTHDDSGSTPTAADRPPAPGAASIPPL
jgi:hypothetical protein